MVTAIPVPPKLEISCPSIKEEPNGRPVS